MKSSAKDFARTSGTGVVLCVLAAVLAGHLALGMSLFAQGVKTWEANSNTSSRRLKLGQRLRVKLRGGGSRSYKIRADGGEFMHVVVEQNGVGLAVALFDPSGKQLAEVHAFDAVSHGPESISAIAESSGDFRLQIIPLSNDASPSRYDVRLTDLRVHTEVDRTRVAAERAYMEGQQLFDQGLRLYQTQSGDSYGQAIEDYERAAAAFHSAGDAGSEAKAWNRAGVIYSALGDKQKAVDIYTQALVLWRSAGDQKAQATTLNNLGVALHELGEMQEALNDYDKALSIFRDLGDLQNEAMILTNTGYVYASLGEKQEALDFFNKALAIHQRVDDQLGKANTLNGAGLVYSDLGELRKALDYFGIAQLIFGALDDRRGEAMVLNNIAGVYNDLYDKQRALDYYSQVLALAQALGDRQREATALNNMGGAYADLGENQKALEYYSQALPLMQAVSDRHGEAWTLNNIGLAYDDLGEKKKALDYYTQALPFSPLGDEDRAVTLKHLARVYSDLGEKQKALDYYTQALPIFLSAQDPLEQADTLVDLMQYWASAKNSSLAIFFGKQAIDRFQQLRQNIGGLGKESQQTFLKSKEQYYRDLAELLISEGRLPEAQQILDLLKAEEYSTFTQRRGDKGSDTKLAARTPMEEKSKKEYEQITGDITAIGQRWIQLQAKASRSADEEKRYSELSDRLTAANQNLQAYLNNLYDTFGKGDLANARVENVDEQTAGLQTLVGELGAHTVAVYTLVLDDKCVLLVITPTTRVARDVAVSKIALRSKVFAFASALAGHHSEEEIQGKAKDLYKILIEPIEEDLKGADATTLVWSLDDVLRYVPLSALYDGKQYLVERYRNVMITTASAGNLKDQPQVSSWRGVAMGVSKDYDGLGQLKAVPEELDSVVQSDATAGSHGPVPGTILLDDSFTVKSMESVLEQHPPLVHIASHYVFKPGDDKKSYLLLGGENTGGQGFHLTLADLRDDQNMDFKGIELLTLSGCQTAVGSNDSDGREIDGLGIMAQRKGAKAVMATLWPVDDASVGLLMATFYTLWISTPEMTKVEALQQAQLAILHGTAVSSASESKQSTASQYANPFYWAPFILIGNWK